MNRLDFWRDPSQADDEIRAQDFYPYTLPEYYLDNHSYSHIVNDSIRKYANRNWSILDLGCGTGRGLADLSKSGYYNLSGVDINCNAIGLGKVKYHRDLLGISLVCSPIEVLFKDKTIPFDLIYSVETLMYLPYDLDWMLEQIAKSTLRMIITVENETDVDTIKYPRNYRNYFDFYGWKQIEKVTGDNYPPITEKTIKRTFVK